MRKVTVHKSWDHRNGHAEYTVWFKTASGRNSWLSGLINTRETNEATLEHLLSLMTGFVQRSWYHIELSGPGVEGRGFMLATCEDVPEEKPT